MQAEVLLFQDGKSTFALRLSDIKEISNLRQLTQLPFAADYLLGLVYLRGRSVPIISAYLTRFPCTTYQRKVDYAAMIEFDDMHLGIACQKIIGVKPLASIVGRQQKIILIEIDEFLRTVSDQLMDRKYGVHP